jgi:membrane protease YdiL (CAAX protease family)
VRAVQAPIAHSVKRPHRWGLGDFLLVELSYLLASVAFVPLLFNRAPSVWLLALAVAVPAAIAAALALLITTLRGNGPATDLRLHWSWRGLGLGLLFGFGGLFVTLPAAVLYVSIAGPDANSAVGELFAGIQASWLWAVVVFVMVVFVAPVCEEIVYRGLLWEAVEWRWGGWVALAVTTVVFAVVHLEPSRIPLLLVLAIPIGLARLYSGGLLASIVAHQVTNLLPGVVIMLGLAGVTLPT